MSELRPPDERPPGRRQTPADQATVRRSNLGLVLRHLRDHGPRSRARIAQETGLNKATVSSLVAELTERGLVSAGELHRGGTAGRPGLIVHLDGRSVCGIGVELNVDYVAVLVLDLCGTVLFEERVGLDVPALDVDRTLDEVARLVRRAVDAAGEQGASPAGVTLAVPGLVQSAAGVVSLAPNLHWTDVPVLDGLRQRLDLACPMRVENDANLSAIAEWSMGAEARTPDLVYLTGEVGVGGGVISGGRLLSGADGLSGEVGHLALGDPADVCGCGRRGCWETAVGTALGVGGSVLINLVNPRVVVLGGYFAVLGRFLLEPMTTELSARVFGPGLAGARVVLSTLGFTAAVRGGAHLALDAVFDDPTLVPAAGDPATSPLIPTSTEIS